MCCAGDSCGIRTSIRRTRKRPRTSFRRSSARTTRSCPRTRTRASRRWRTSDLAAARVRRARAQRGPCCPWPRTAYAPVHAAGKQLVAAQVGVLIVFAFRLCACTRHHCQRMHLFSDVDQAPGGTPGCALQATCRPCPHRSAENVYHLHTHQVHSHSVTCKTASLPLHTRYTPTQSLAKQSDMSYLPIMRSKRFQAAQCQKASHEQAAKWHLPHFRTTGSGVGCCGKRRCKLAGCTGNT